MCTGYKNGVEGSHQNPKGRWRSVSLSSHPLHGAIQKGRPFCYGVFLLFRPLKSNSSKSLDVVSA